ncbi:MAG: hypothetical protein QOJ89_1033 [bacterium]
MRLRRREDLLHLDYEFYNLIPDPADPGQLIKHESTDAAWVVITLPPQSLFERTFAETDDGSPFAEDPARNLAADPLTAPPVPTRLAGPSRLAFVIPPAAVPLPFDLAHLLDWTAWQPRVVPSAIDAAPAANNTRSPLATQTAIELPWWLLLSPLGSQRWSHSRTPVILDGRADLWQTSLQPGPAPNPVLGERSRPLPGVRFAGGPAAVQAVWALDRAFTLDPAHEPSADGQADFPAGHAALTGRDRFDIVQNSSVRRPAGAYVPLALQVKRLSLSALGGSIDADGAWKNSINSLIRWTQRGTYGRDHYVRVIRRGYLFPFGHAAVLTTISERKFAEVVHNGVSRTVAYLRQRRFLVVAKGTKTYQGAFGQQHEGRGLPFIAADVLTHVTPLLDPPAALVPAPAEPGPAPRPDPSHGPHQDPGPDPASNPFLGADQAFVPFVDGHRFRFHMQGIDWRGDPVEFTTPLVWVDAIAARDATLMRKLRHWYDDIPDADIPKGLAVTDPLRRGHFGGRRVSLAASGADGDTAHQVNTICWGAQELGGHPSLDELEAHDQPRFFPTLVQANVRLAAAEHVSGTAVGGVDVAYHRSFVGTDTAPGGFDSPANRGQIYLTMLAPHSLAFGGGNGGGVIRPDFVIHGLSRLIGPVGGSSTDDDPLAAAMSGSFDARSFFASNGDPKLAPQILGGIKLEDIVQDGGLQIAPTITTTRAGDVETTSMQFSPDLQSDDKGIFDPFDPQQPDTTVATMDVVATIVSHLSDPTQASTTIDGDLRNFTMHMIAGTPELVNFIDLHFAQLRFHSQTGQEATVDPHIDDVTFKGVLLFIEELKKYLDFGSNAPAIELTPTQVSATTGLAIPNIELGVFSLSDLSFLATLVIPFTGAPAGIEFAFCSRENPFHLTIECFGGGGWFGVELGLDGLHSFEAGLEFGAAIAFDIGVAAGEVHIWAGIYFKMAPPVDDPGGELNAHIEGYVRAGGSLVIAGGVASVSLELYLGFTYDQATSKVGGEARLHLTVSVLCFSGSVDIDFQQYFGGQNDPTFAELIPPDDPGLAPAEWTSRYWTDYCNAFAPDA